MISKYIKFLSYYFVGSNIKTMHLYPQVPIDSKCSENKKIFPDSTYVEKGWMVGYLTYTMGRMEGIWGNNWDDYLSKRWLENGMC